MRLDDYPSLYLVSDRASLRAQRLQTRLLGVQLWTAILAGAASAFVSALPDRHRPTAHATVAAILVSSVICAWVLRAQRFDQMWFRTRAVAESVKTATWRYMMAVAPYLDGGDVDAAFVSNVIGIRRARGGIDTHVAHEGSRVITDAMRRVRGEPETARRAYYLAHRLRDQQAWYSRKSASNRTAGQRWFALAIVTQLAGLIAAIAMIVVPEQRPNIVSVLMALANGALAWTHFRKHDELAQFYAQAANELAELDALITSATDSILERRVEEAEDAMSREHTMWVARRIQ